MSVLPSSPSCGVGNPSPVPGSRAHSGHRSDSEDFVMVDRPTSDPSGSRSRHNGGGHESRDKRSGGAKLPTITHPRLGGSGSGSAVLRQTPFYKL